LTILIFNFYLC